MIMFDTLFEILDLNEDGEISRSELHKAVQRLGWYWYEAPIFAILDLLTIDKTISKEQFTAYIKQISEDPMGPYGGVLINSPHFSSARPASSNQSVSPKLESLVIPRQKPRRDNQENGFSVEFTSDLGQIPGADMANSYRRLVNTLNTPQISVHNAALLVIDPQLSFTKGVWMQSIGKDAAVDVKPIETAFDNCFTLLAAYYSGMEVMFSRCPFPPDSYAWDDRLAQIIDSNQLYFIKPGNSILFPPLNGFTEWVDRFIHKEITTLVIGGCTTNSCVRVSAIETLNRFKDKNLQVIVDLSICGARARNFIPSSSYKGRSAVESAVQQMINAGVQVVRCVKWKGN